MLALAVCVGLPPVVCEEARLRPLSHIIKALTDAEKPELSEFAYISARGAGLYAALSAIIKASPRNDKEKKLAESYFALSHKHFQVAMVAGMRANQDLESTKAQVKLFFDNYTAMAVKSRQEDNEIFSPEILADLDALKEIQPNILALAANIQKQFDEFEKTAGK